MRAKDRATTFALCQESWNHRYAEDEWEEPYLFTALPGTPNPVVVLKALDCFEYQSCEHPGWRMSEANRFCEAMRKMLIAKLPGYDKAEAWAVRSRNVFLNSPRLSTT